MKKYGAPVLLALAFAIPLCAQQNGHSPEGVDKEPASLPASLETNAGAVIAIDSERAGSHLARFVPKHVVKAFKDNIKGIVLSLKMGNDAVDINLTLSPKNGSDMAAVLAGSTISKNFQEAAFLPSDAAIVVASAVRYDQNAIDAFANLIGKIVGKRPKNIINAVLDAGLIEPEMTTFAEILTDKSEIVIITKTDLNFDGVYEKAVRIARIYNSSKVEPKKIAIGKFDAVSLPASVYGRHTYHFATVVKGFEIILVSADPNSYPTLEKYALAVEAGVPLPNNVKDKIGDNHRMLSIDLNALIAQTRAIRMGIPNTSAADLYYTHKYDVDNNFRIKLPDGSFDPITIYARLENNEIKLKLSLTFKNLAEFAKQCCPMPSIKAGKERNL